MRCLLAPLLLTALCFAQSEEGLRQASGAAFSGFGSDDKAEKTWEIRAATVRPEIGEVGAWRLTDLKLTTFRDGKPQRVLRTPSGLARPDRLAAEGEGAVRIEGEGLRLDGVGWSWRGTEVGDTFALLSGVRGDVGNLARPENLARLSAARLDVVSGLEGTTDLIFAGGARMNRGVEQLAADRLVLTIGREGNLSGWAALGGVRHTYAGGSAQADEIRHDALTGKTRFLGAVQATDTRATLTTSALTRELDGAWMAEDGAGVRVELPAVEGRPAAKVQSTLVRALAPTPTESVFVFEGDARYQSETSELRARTLRIGLPIAGQGWVEGQGGVMGNDGGLNFQAEEARLDRDNDTLLLQGNPRLADKRGFVLSGFQIRARPQAGTADVLSGIGRRAALRTLSDGAPAEFEAERIEASRQGERAVARLLGSVRLRLPDAEMTCERVVATARLTKQNTTELERLVLVGEVAYRSEGFLARAGRAELHPAVGLEAAVTAELGGAARLLLLLPGEDDPVMPRLEISQGESLLAVEASRHEVLLSSGVARFHSEGNVRLVAGGAEGTCERIQGLARRDAKGRLLLASALGSGDIALVSGGVRATGERLEIDPLKNLAHLRGAARLRDDQGRLGVPADAITYDLKTRNWSMDSSPGGTPGSVIKPKILLPGTVFQLPLPQ